jgi:uracil-DNA glycosylase
MTAPCPTLPGLLADIRACRACAQHIQPRPVLVAESGARLLIAGQAPGSRVHASGIPWDDVSGQRLRDWLGLDEAQFYDASRVAIVPMGFCYPGQGRSGDLPPRPECRVLWHDRLFACLPALRVRVIIGEYAQAYHLAGRRKANLTDTVAAWRDYAPAVFPLPHPSPRNRGWLARQPAFETELLPALRSAVHAALRS